MVEDLIETKAQSKSNFGIYKEANLKSKEYSGNSSLQSTHKQVDFDKIISSNKKTEFIIPKNLGREVTEDKDTLSKYLKDTSTIQSHTIHISELLNSSSKGQSSYSNKSQALGYSSGKINNIIGHKRVKSHHLINVSTCLVTKFRFTLRYQKSCSLINNKGDVGTSKGVNKNIFSSQSVSSDMKISEESLNKKSEPYKIRMTKNKGIFIYPDF